MDLHEKFFSRNGFDPKKESINIVVSIARCKPLYKELIKLAHPDKHPDKVALAEEISQKINASRYNYAKLIKLKSRIEGELL